MRLFPFLLTLLLTLTPQASAQNDLSCEPTSKDATDQTTITCANQPVDVLKQPPQNIFHAVAALSHTGDEANALSLVTGSASSHFSKIDTATALIDGERHKFKASYTNGEAKAGVAIEQVVVVIPFEHTDAIRKAETFWIRLNDVVFNLRPTIAQMQRIHEMRTTAGSPP